MAGSSKADIVGIHRLWNDDLFTFIDTAHHSEKQRLRAAIGDNEIRWIYFDIDSSLVVNIFLCTDFDKFTER